MNISEKLKELRYLRKMTATYVSYELGIAKSTLSNYENGLRTPKVQTLSKFAEFYNTTLDSLVNPEPNKMCTNISYIHRAANHTPIPILNHTNKLQPLISEENVIGYTDLGSEYKGKGEFFAMYITDDSMANSRICEGDIVIVRKQPKVENGEIAVVLIEGENATVKKIFYADNLITLMPSANDTVHKVKIVDTNTSNVNVLGKVVEVKIKL